MKKEANIINSIKENVSLDEHFDSLNIFEKREMIDEFKQSKESKCSSRDTPGLIEFMMFASFFMTLYFVYKVNIDNSNCIKK